MVASNHYSHNNHNRYIGLAPGCHEKQAIAISTTVFFFPGVASNYFYHHPRRYIHVFVFFHLLVCWMNARKDQDILRNYKPLSKKVKNMTRQQKKHWKQGNDALWREKYLFCQYNGAKIVSILSVLIATFVVYPYAKKERSVLLFILLVVLLLPLIFLTSLAFFLTLSSFHQFS